MMQKIVGGGVGKYKYIFFSLKLPFHIEISADFMGGDYKKTMHSTALKSTCLIEILLSSF